MPESAAKHRRCPKWAAWLLMLGVLVLLVVLFWERAATEVYLRMAVSKSPLLRRYGRDALHQLGPRAVPYVIPHLDSSDWMRADWARRFIDPYWSSLSGDELQAAARAGLRPEVEMPIRHQSGMPLAYIVRLVPVAPLFPKAVDILERVELVEEGKTTVSLEIPHSGPRLDLARVPGSEELVAHLQEVGQHQLLFTLSLVDARLSRPVPIGQVTRTLTTLERAPGNSFVTVANPTLDSTMRDAFTLQTSVSNSLPGLVFVCTGKGTAPVASSVRVWVRIRETGQFVAGPFTCLLRAGDPAIIMCYVYYDWLPVEPGKTYHLQCVLKGDPEEAWANPAIAEFWDGELADNWVKVTVPELEDH